MKASDYISKREQSRLKVFCIPFQWKAILTKEEVKGLTPRWVGTRQHSFVEIDHKIFSMVISADSRRAVVSFWQINLHNTG